MVLEWLSLLGVSLSDLPPLNASLNFLAALCLLAAYYFIKVKQNQQKHVRSILAAIFFSALFLTSYLIYHTYSQHMTPYPGQGWGKIFYYGVLITHVPLAGILLPCISAAVWQAYKRRWEAHRRIVRWLWPVWMYVSLTGILIYFMLYKF